MLINHIILWEENTVEMVGGWHRLLLEDHFTIHTGIFTVETHRTWFSVLCQAKFKFQCLLSVVEVKIKF